MAPTYSATLNTSLITTLITTLAIATAAALAVTNNHTEIMTAAAAAPNTDGAAFVLDWGEEDLTYPLLTNVITDPSAGRSVRCLGTERPVSSQLATPPTPPLSFHPRRASTH